MIIFLLNPLVRDLSKFLSRPVEDLRFRHLRHGRVIITKSFYAY